MRKENNYICIYCGAPSDCRDHVIPVAYLSLARGYDPEKQWIVPACNNCNLLAGPYIAFSIAEKAQYILGRFRCKYKKLLKHPEWQQDELDDLDYSLRTMIWGGLVAKRVALEREKILIETCELPSDYKRPDFVTNQIEEANKVFKRNIKRKKYKQKKQLKSKYP